MEVVILCELIIIVVLIGKFIKWKVVAEAMVEYNKKNNIPFLEEEYTECCRKVAKKILKFK